MNAAEVIATTLVFGLACWLGAYLIGRDWRNATLRCAGFGIITYALAWGCDAIARATATGKLSTIPAHLCWPLPFLPALLWTGALITLVPETVPFRARFARIWQYGVLPVTALIALAGIVTNIGGVARVVFSLIVLVPLLFALILVGRAKSAIQPTRSAGIFFVSALFFALSTTLLLVSPDWLPHVWLLLLVGVDVIALGVVIAALDAFDQGEALVPDMIRSFDAAFLTALLFGGQVALVMLLATGPTPPLLLLLLATVATAIAVPTFADPLGAAFDRVALSRFPQMRAARAELRETASALPRATPAFDPTTLDDAEFTRLTRRALSHFGDLPRLATSPLIHLPLVDCRLAARHAPDDVLERAAELKAVLAESIARLKPRAGGDFGTSDEWRYYNALYFPYIAGLKPYRRATNANHDDPVTRAALEWFRINIPERTLYNWQTTAARLVAQDLRTRSEHSGE